MPKLSRLQKNIRNDLGVNMTKNIKLYRKILKSKYKNANDLAKVADIAVTAMYGFVNGRMNATIPEKQIIAKLLNCKISDIFDDKADTKETKLKAELENIMLSQRGLAKITGINRTILNGICTGRWNANKSEKNKICSALGCDERELF